MSRSEPSEQLLKSSESNFCYIADYLPTLAWSDVQSSDAGISVTATLPLRSSAKNSSSNAAEAVRGD